MIIGSGQSKASFSAYARAVVNWNLSLQKAYAPRRSIVTALRLGFIILPFLFLPCYSSGPLPVSHPPHFPKCASTTARHTRHGPNTAPATTSVRRGLDRASIALVSVAMVPIAPTTLLNTMRGHRPLDMLKGIIQATIRPAACNLEGLLIAEGTTMIEGLSRQVVPRW